MTAKERYRALCNQEKGIPIFIRDWWLDVVCGIEGWDVVLSGNEKQVTGALPFALSKKMGLTFLNMPKLTGFMGPWIFYPQGQKYATKLSFEMEVYQSLIEQLPAFDLYRQRFHYSVGNWLPYYWKGFEQTTRYSYLIELTNADAIFAEFKSSVRGKIRKASELVSVTHDRPLQDFYQLFSLTFQRQGITPPVTFSYLSAIDAALAKQNARRIFYAIDNNNRVHSALYLIWDNQSAYVHMLGEDPQLRGSGAGSLLIWEAIKFAKAELPVNTFDFLGSMIEPIETVRRAFGARQVPYFQVKKVNSLLLRMAFLLKKDSAALR